MKRQCGWLSFSILLTGCGVQPDPDAFTLKIVPDHWNRTFVGQRVVLLVIAEDNNGSSAAGDAVTITAEADNCDTTVVLPSLLPGRVGEVFVVPHVMPSGTTVTATVRGRRGDVERSAEVTFEVINEPDDLGEEAIMLRDRFVPWLEANHPELGITADTVWEGTSVQHLLVVSHYLFLSDEWELGVAWHIMIPPYDWTQIYLRRRFTESVPSLAFEIDSRSDPESAPHAIDPPESVPR